MKTSVNKMKKHFPFALKIFKCKKKKTVSKDDIHTCQYFSGNVLYFQEKSILNT